MPKYTLLVALIAVTGCTSTLPQSGGIESYYFDCDTAAGSFSEWNRSIAGSSLRATGTIELRKTRDDPRWVPAASVWFVGPDGIKRSGIKVFVLPSSPDNIQIRLLTASSEESSPVFAQFQWHEGPLPFTLSLGESDVLTATIAGETQSVHVTNVPVTKFALNCSTGDFHFKDVRVVSGRDR